MSKYKHAMEIIENWDRVEQFVQITPGCPMWTKPNCEPGYYRLQTLNSPGEFRIKREPRRVWVNYSESGFPMAYESQEVAMCKGDYPEKAVEFVEVVK